MNDFKSPLVVAYYNVDYVKNVKGKLSHKDQMTKSMRLLQWFNFFFCGRHKLLEEPNFEGGSELC